LHVCACVDVVLSLLGAEVLKFERERESYGKGGLLLIRERELDVVEAHEVLDQLLVQILLGI